jgi:hypothetical protein
MKRNILYVICLYAGRLASDICILLIELHYMYFMTFTEYLRECVSTEFVIMLLRLLSSTLL